MSRMDRFGGMPFAVIAVALLLASTAIVATVHQYGGTEDGAEDVEDGIDAVDMALADVQMYVNRGLGEIVRGLSTASNGVTDAADTVEERTEAFREIGYDGWCTVECLPYPDPETAAERAVKFLRARYI